ncbi:MAG: hypothetical protein JSS43_18275 [Proteobacteria bacterium]|nr:hypothetical protein [Pseudomonadota bacterium]
MADMSTEPQRADVDTLREALRKVKKFVPPKKLLAYAAELGRVPEIFSDRAFRAFMAPGSKGGITTESFDLLAAAWLYSPIGHVARNLDRNPPTAFAELIRHLGEGGAKRDDRPAVDGAYFMYHGSYLRPGHLVIRVITIRSGSDHIITVTDTVRDGITLRTRDRIAEGVMTYYSGNPQILLWGQENKQGLSLIIGSQTEAPGKVLSEMSGAFIVMQPGGEAAFRKYLLRREPQGDPAIMLEESAIFLAKEIDLPERQRHRDAFDTLKRVASNEVFPDPMLAYGQQPSRAIRKARAAASR